VIGDKIMPRKPREIADGFVYHILNRGNFKKVVFHTAYDYRSFLKLMEDGKKNYAIDIFAYCLMPNHFHFVVRPRIADHLSKWMHGLMNTHVQRFRIYYQTTGHIWQDRYKNFIIQQDEHLLTVLRYVERNPVRANLVPSAIDWPWSSVKERMKKTSTSMMDIPPIDLPNDWNEFVNQPLTAMELDDIHYSIKRQAPYGSKRWQQKICEDLGLEHTLRPKGRPKKKQRQSKKQKRWFAKIDNTGKEKGENKDSEE
jgi:putative transposase